MRLHGHKWEQNLILGLFKSILYNASFMCTFRKQWQSEAFQVLVNASSGAVQSVWQTGSCVLGKCTI